MAIGPDGAVYVTDSLQPRILQLKQGANTFETWVSDPQWKGEEPQLDGIAFGSDGNLYVNTYQGGGFYRVNVKPDHTAGRVTKLQTSSPLDHPDGMRRFGSNGLLMVEGGGRFDIITVNGDSAQIKVVKDGLVGPVSVVQVGKIAYVLEGQLKYLFDPDFAKQKPQPFRAYAVPLPAAP